MLEFLLWQIVNVLNSLAAAYIYDAIVKKHH